MSNLTGDYIIDGLPLILEPNLAHIQKLDKTQILKLDTYDFAVLETAESLIKQEVCNSESGSAYLLQYPLSRGLSISHCEFHTDENTIFHSCDSTTGSSGGLLYCSNGLALGIHLGSESKLLNRAMPLDPLLQFLENIYEN